MSNTTQSPEKSNRPPYRVVCNVGQPERRFWEQNGVGFAHKTRDGAIVFTPPFDIKAGTPCMLVENAKGNEASGSNSYDGEF